MYNLFIIIFTLIAILCGFSKFKESDEYIRYKKGKEEIGIIHKIDNKDFIFIYWENN